MEKFFRTIVDFGNHYVWEFPSGLPWLVVLLVGAGVFVTFRLLWVQIRRFGHAIQVIRGKYDDPNDEGDINHFQALTTALSATVGIGNIAGVATAIHYGGPGAIFWMWITAIFGMALKFAECTLSMHYRKFDDKGDAVGGPMYYIEKGLGKKWKWMAILFAALAIVCSFGTGNMNQANSVAVSAYSEFAIPDWVTGVTIAAIVGLVIIGGIKRIGAVTSKLMPFMAIIYIVGSLTILLTHIQEIPGVFATIFESAFSPKAGFGGTSAGIFSLTMLWGIKRGLFSNEAGQGSAPIAHAAAKTKEPVREGTVAMIGPFIDTLVICTMTAMVIVITGVWNQKKVDSYMPFSQNKAKIYQVPNIGKTVTDQDINHKGQREKTFVASFDKKYKADLVKGALPAPLTKYFNGKIKITAKETIFSLYDISKNDMYSIVPIDGKYNLYKHLKRFVGTMTVTNGKTSKILVIVNDGIVSNMLLIDNTTLKPYTGPVTLDKKGNIFGKNKAKIALKVKGGMLQNSSAMTAWAFQKGLSRFGNWGNYVVTIAVFLFAISTMISWSYYGERCVVYLFGTRYILLYRLIYIFFSCLGAILALETVWAYGDLALGLMSIPNLIAVIFLSGVVVRLTKDYFSRMAKQ